MNLPAPRWVCLQLLQECNLRCRMCYEWGTTGVHKSIVRPAQLDFAVVERVVHDLAPHRPHFDLFGGEPLLYPEIEQVVRLIKGAGSTLELATNGTRLAEQAEMLTAAGVDRLWISLDGPPAINDWQRGRGTFSAVTQGIAALHGARGRGAGQRPRIGVTFVVTPSNQHVIAETFLQAVDRRALDIISIEYQSYVTQSQLAAYEALLRERFDHRQGTPFAASLLREVAAFSSVDAAGVVRQIEEVRQVYEAEGKQVSTKPRSTTEQDTRAYFSGRFAEMADYHKGCVFPWIYLEVAASGAVTPCHTFYDLSCGNVNDQPILDIWRSQRFDALRAHLRDQLLPVCTACCLYYTAPIPLSAPAERLRRPA